MNGLSAPQRSFWPENGKYRDGTEGTASEVTGSCSNSQWCFYFPLVQLCKQLVWGLNKSAVCLQLVVVDFAQTRLVQTKLCGVCVCAHTARTHVHTCSHSHTHSGTRPLQNTISVWYNTVASRVSCLGLCTNIILSPVTAWPSWKLCSQGTFPTRNRRQRSWDEVQPDALCSCCFPSAGCAPSFSLLSACCWCFGIKWLSREWQRTRWLRHICQHSGKGSDFLEPSFSISKYA